MVAVVLLAWAAVSASRVATCPEKVLANIGLGGGSSVTALLNVTSQADCESIACAAISSVV